MTGRPFSISAVELDTVADVSGIGEPEFREEAELAKRTCPVSKALAGVSIALSARLADERPGLA